MSFYERKKYFSPWIKKGELAGLIEFLPFLLGELKLSLFHILG